MNLKKGQQQGRDERTQEDYPKSAVYFLQMYSTHQMQSIKRFIRERIRTRREACAVVVERMHAANNTRLLLAWSAFSRMSKCVCSACEMCFMRVSLACETRSPRRKLLKRVLRRIQHVCSALIDSQTCSPVVSVSIYHVDNFPIHLAVCFLKSHSCSTHESFSSGKNVLQNFGNWLESVLAMYTITIITLAALMHRAKVKRWIKNKWVISSRPLLAFAKHTRRQ